MSLRGRSPKQSPLNISHSSDKEIASSGRAPSSQRHVEKGLLEKREHELDEALEEYQIESQERQIVCRLSLLEHQT